MHDRWLRQMPDELDEEVLAEVEDVDEAVRIREAFATMKRIDGENLQRKQDLFERHGLMFQGQNDMEIRFNLLVDMFIGTLSEERLRFEVQWLLTVKRGMEHAYSEYLAQEKAQGNGLTLPDLQQYIEIPGKGRHVVPPKDDDGNE